MLAGLRQKFAVALRYAEMAYDSGEIPVGCAIFQQEKLVSCCANRGFYHAEVLAIDAAQQILGGYLLPDCQMYVTLEPCVMCAGMIASTRIQSLYYGAYDPKGGAVDHNAMVFRYTAHRPQVYAGIQEQRCAKLLTDFFHCKRR